jgi:serine/threonine protein kinase
MGADPAAEAVGRDDAGEKRLLKLGRYEVVRELGKGAMGVVYLAKDPIIGRLVALKTIRASAHADDEETKEFQQRFTREAQAAGILNHPAIVTVHDIGQDDSGTSFIAMEYVEGNNLKEVLAQGRTLSFDTIGDIVAQVADALDFAHSKGIVHRDVKPANIILLEGHRAKITDFGIAKIASGAANLTTTGQFLGTPNYMAPEQIKGAPVDGRTDIFSLGICLYECLTRRKPFGGDSLTSISYKIVHEPFPPLHEINPTIPESFEEVVSHCLAKDPAKRYQRGRELAAALRAVLRGERPTRVSDPVLEEVTMVTRERAAPPMPTVEVPFPQAQEASGPGGVTRPVSGTSHTAIAPPAAPAVPREPVSKQVRRTLTNVRTMPVWRSRIPPALFFGVVAILVAALIAAVAGIRSKFSDTSPADMQKWSLVAHERHLRMEARSLLAQGRVTDARPKFEELSRLAPKSPYVTGMLDRLNLLRQRDEVSKQQLVQAQTLFDEGMTLYNNKQFDQAIEKFQQSFTINPSAIQTGDYLKLAQQELQKADEARAAARAQKLATQKTAAATTPTTKPATPTGGDGTTTPAVPAAPTKLTTVFTHKFTDGRIIVRAGGDIVANEQLFTVRKGGFLRRAANIAKPINVTHEFPAKNADVDIWVTVPAKNISEHHVLQFRFQPGSSHTLVVHVDEASNKFTYELN